MTDDSRPPAAVADRPCVRTENAWCPTHGRTYLDNAEQCRAFETLTCKCHGIGINACPWRTPMGDTRPPDALEQADPTRESDPKKEARAILTARKQRTVTALRKVRRILTERGGYGWTDALAVVDEALALAAHPVPDSGLREVLKATLSALAITVTNVPTTGRPHWCQSTGGHDPTCSGMLKTQDQARAALASTPEPDLTEAFD